MPRRQITFSARRQWSRQCCVGTLMILSALVIAAGSVAVARTNAPPVEFALTDHRGNEISSQSLRGKPSMLLFGFTGCPDVCPTTLLEIGNVLEAMGNDASRLNVLFVTIDPERDTRQHLATYLSSFDRRIIGATGDMARIDRLAKELGLVYEKIPQKNGYTFNHSVFAFLLDGAGRPSGKLLIGHGAPLETSVKRLKTFISESENSGTPTNAAHTPPR